MKSLIIAICALVSLAGCSKNDIQGSWRSKSIEGTSSISIMKTSKYTVMIDMLTVAKNTNMGVIQGTGYINAAGDEIEYKSGNCVINMKLQNNELLVFQLSQPYECGFGFGVISSGIYEQRK